MTRYLKLAAALFRYSLTRELMFKGNFLLWIVVEFLWFGIQLTMIQVIFQHTQEVAGWNKYQMIVLTSTSLLVQQLFQFVFMINCMELPENIRMGKLDFALLQPANSQFLVSVRKYDLGALVTGTGAAGIAGYALSQLHVVPSLMQWMLFGALVINGILIHYALMLALVSLSFWIVRAQGLVYGYYNLFQIARIPKDAFSKGVRIFFTFVLPMTVVANYPAGVLVHRLEGVGVLWVFGIAAGLLLLVNLWFKFALRFYTSASS